jgi:hypothetical protein
MNNAVLMTALPHSSPPHFVHVHTFGSLRVPGPISSIQAHSSAKSPSTPISSLSTRVQPHPHQLTHLSSAYLHHLQSTVDHIAFRAGGQPETARHTRGLRWVLGKHPEPPSSLTGTCRLQTRYRLGHRQPRLRAKRPPRCLQPYQQETPHQKTQEW